MGTLSDFPSQGKIIVFEGPEGVGKTNHIRRVVKEIGEGIMVPVREPGGTILGDEIRRLLLDPNTAAMCHLSEFLLFWASRAELAYKDVQPLINQGKHVIYDRFIPSTFAYNVRARQQNLDVLFDYLMKEIYKVVEPDCYIYLDVDPMVGLERAEKRSKADKMESEGIEFHRRVADGYKEFFSKHPHRRVDANRSEEEVYKEVYAIVAETCGLG